MAKRDVDPDADTVMPVSRREEPGKGTGTSVVVEGGGARIDAELLSVSAHEAVVRATQGLPVDTEVRASCDTGGRKLSAGARVVWTRSQGASVAVGLAFSDPATGREWAELLG